jgi:membrane-associated phospholipid phosphatase
VLSSGPTSSEGIFHYWFLLVRASLVAIPALFLLIMWIDEPLAGVIHHYGPPLKPLFEWVMLGQEWLGGLFFYRGIPVAWLGLLLLFLLLRLRRRPHCTVWLVVLLTWISSEGITNLLKGYFNRPRPYEVWSQVAPNANFWQEAGRFYAFPSGHTAWMAGLLLPLALRFPRLRPGLLAGIGLVAVSRLGLEQHWLSDVAASVYLSLLLACGFEMSTWWLRPRSASSLLPSAPDAT